MASKKKKKPVDFTSHVEPGKFASPVTGDYVESVPAPAPAPLDVKVEDDTDISKKIHDVIEHKYPRTRVGTDGWLHAILCELIRARLSK